MVFGSLLDFENSKILIEMGKEVEDVEEGEISDSASLEEITEADFNKGDDVKVNNSDVKVDNKVKTGGGGGGGGGDSRVWAVQDLYSKYPTICRGYASGLYNLAWAQAVQNKPLNDIFVMELDKNANANSNNSGNKDGELNKSSKEIVVVDDDDDADDDEKEEGELEEGEIDGDADDDCVIVGSENFSNSEVVGVRDVLEGVTVASVAE